MKRSIKLVLFSLSVGAVTLATGCGGSWVWKMLGDAVGDTAIYNVFLD